MLIYDTVILRQQKPIVDKAVAFYAQHKILDTGSIQPSFTNVDQLAPDNTTLSQWNHPIILDFKDKKVAFIDPRPHVAIDGRVRNKQEYEFLQMRAMLEHVWATRQEEYQNVMDGASAVYAEWITSAIRRRFNTNLAELETMRVVLAVFYWLKVLTPRELETANQDLLRGMIIRFVTRNLRMPVDMINRIMSHIAFNHFLQVFLDNRNISLDDLSTAVNDIVGSTSVTLSANLLMQLLIDGSWFGFSARELAVAALEHPPVMVYFILQTGRNSLYRRTNIGIATDMVRRSRTNVAAVDPWVRSFEEEYKLV